MTKKLIILGAALILAVAACGGDDSDDNGGGGGSDTTVAGGDEATGDAAKGEELFVTCAACHGPAGEGIEGLGKPMPGSAFIAGLSDDELVVFIKEGRGTGDPENTTGVDMPANGGNPALSDQDLLHIVAFIRSLG
ncbi:MAG: cytochrome c [bacterium]|nr:cytochrome c [bacterium]